VLGRVFEHGLEDEVGQPAFDAAHGLHGRLAIALLPFVVVPAGFVVAELDAGHDVQHPVDLSVPAAGESVPDLVAGGDVDGGGAVPRREVRIGALLRLFAA
jgi:hypothetical protein